jgi:Retinal pigment epithelial membrane protein
MVDLVMGRSPFTDNASVSLQLAGSGLMAGGAHDSSSSGVLLAMSETPNASYLVRAEDLTTIQRVEYEDNMPGYLTTAHPGVMSDGTLVNFTRSLPFGGFHVYRQDPVSLRRTQARVFLSMCVSVCLRTHSLLSICTGDADSLRGPGRQTDGNALVDELLSLLINARPTPVASAAAHAGCLHTW